MFLTTNITPPNSLISRTALMAGVSVISASWTMPGTATIGIVERSVSQSAPEAIMFDVTSLGTLTPSTPPSGSIYDHAIHDYRYYWDFGDTGAVYSAPVNVLANWNSRNVAYTKKASHVYRTPGTYTVSVLIVELSTGSTESATFQVTVGDFTALTGYREVQVGSDVSDDYTTLAAALVAESSETNPTRYRVRRGHTESGGTVGTNDMRFRGHVQIISDLGSGAKPEIQWADSFYFQLNNTVAFVMQDIVFKGGYDCTTNTYVYGGNPHYLFRLWGDTASSRYAFGSFLLDRCTLTECNSGVQSENTGAGQNNPDKLLCFHDCLFADWMNYGTYLDDYKTAILGCRFAQDPNVTSAWGIASGATRQHGPMRSAGADVTVIDGCDFVDQAGWVVNITSPNSYATQQPCIRFNMSQFEGAELHVSRTSFEGGFQHIWATAMNQGQTVRQQNIFITSCYAVGSWMNESFAAFGTGGVSIENVMWVPTTAPRIGSNFAALSLVWLTDNYVVADSHVRTNPIRVSNCDTVDELGTTTTTVRIDPVWGTSDVVVEDCQTFTSVSAGTHDLTQLWTPVYTGYYAPNAIDGISVITPRDTSKATPTDEVLKYELLTKVPATGSRVPYWDITGTVRASDWKGAWGGSAAAVTRPYGANAPWNIPVASLTHATSEATRVNELYIQSSPVNWNLRQNDYTYPVYHASDATGTYEVQTSFGNAVGTSIPFNPSWTAAPGTDAQIIILDTATGEEWNIFQYTGLNGSNQITGTRCNKVQGDDQGTGTTDANYFTREVGYAPSRGAGIQYLAMLVRRWEIEQGLIEHALSMPSNNTAHSGGFGYTTAGFVAPATKAENFGTDNASRVIVEGTRFSLEVSDAEITSHLASLPADVSTTMKDGIRAILVAMRDYGWFITDTSGANGLQLECDVSANWSEVGFDDFVSGVNGKTYPRDALDGIVTEARLRCYVPSDQY